MTMGRNRYTMVNKKIALFIEGTVKSGIGNANIWQ
jgi:hypothetical protein